QRAERVAVGVLVGDEQEALGAQHLLDDLLEARGGGRSVHPPASSSSSSASTRNAFSAVSSRMKRSSGVFLRCSSEAIRPCRKPWAERRPSSEASCSAGEPRMLTYTRACRRSAEVLTSVTVTNPTRGSWRSCATASPTT